MRDDLHKKAPVPRRVQNVLKLALREADRLRPARLQEAAHHALEQLVRSTFSQATLRSLAQSDQQGDLFGGPLVQATSPTESDFLAGCRSADGTVRGALQNSIADAVDSYAREMRATLVADGTVKNVADVMGAVVDAFRSATPVVTDGFCGGSVASPGTPALSLDENLLPNSSTKISK